MTAKTNHAPDSNGILPRIVRALRHGHEPKDSTPIDAEAAAELAKIGHEGVLEAFDQPDPVQGHGAWGFGLGTPAEGSPASEHAMIIRTVARLAAHKPPPPPPPEKSENEMEWKFFEPEDPKEEK